MIVMQVTSTAEERVALAKIISDVQAYEEGRSRRLVAQMLSEPHVPPPTHEAGGTL